MTYLDPLRYTGPSAYGKRLYAQLMEWLAGRPIHNPIDNECCPDFSCCRGVAHMAPLHLREMFVRDPTSRVSMIQDWADRFITEEPIKALSWDLPGVVVMSVVPGKG